MLTLNVWIIFAIFLAVVLIVFLLGTMLAERRTAVDTRLTELSLPTTPTASRTASRHRASRSPLPKVGAALVPKDQTRLNRLKSRLLQAGLYRRHATAVFLGFKVLFMVTPMLVGILLASLGLITVTKGVLFGAIIGVVGNLTPSLWLSMLKGNRQKQIRRAMPDALDVIVICLEGGLSLSASFDRVARELRRAHPLLADEMAIVRREIQLGRSTGEALKQFADRFDAEELRSLASVVVQAEKFGASIVKALRVHAESLRLRRYQHAEAQAQKAPVKLIFPTVLCIFPALYIVLMGPAGVQLLEMLDQF